MLSLDVKMAWRNIWRNPRRSVLTMLAIAFACMLLVFMLSWQFGSYATMINSMVKTHSGHLQVQAKGYNEKKDIRQVVPDPEAVGALLDKIDDVAAYTFRANGFSLVSSKERTYGVLVTGIDPAREAGVSAIKSLNRQGSYLSPDDTNQALVGMLLARNLKVGPGDELTVLGQGRDGSVAANVITVKGIFSSGQDEFDRSSIQIPLSSFQSVYEMGEAVNEVVVLADSLDRVSNIKQELEAGIKYLPDADHLVVLDWMQLMPGVIEAIKLDLASGFIFYIILIVVVAFSILNTFLMAIFERTKEFGVLMAMGTTPWRLTRLLLAESITTTVLGIIVGALAGSLVTWYFQVHGLVISGAADILSQFGLPARIYPRLSVLSLSIGTGVVLLITLITATYPALKVRKLKPVEALAHV